MTSSHKIFEIECHNPVYQLQKCLDQISKPSRDSKIDGFVLKLFCLHVTAPILALLIRILNQPLRTSTTAIKFKWDRVEFHYCTLLVEGDICFVKGYCHCSASDVAIFAKLLAGRTLLLHIDNSDEILERLFRVPKLESKTLSIHQVELSAKESIGLGGLLQRSSTLKHLELLLSYWTKPQTLVESLANATTLQMLSIKDMDLPSFGLVSPLMLADIFRPGGEDIILRLLRNPQCRLQELSLSNMHMEDHQFMAIVEILPTTKLEVLNVDGNKIQCQGILALAAQLPNIKCLKVVGLGGNPWETVGEGLEQCWAALLEGLLENFSVESLSARECSPLLAKSVHYQCNLNRAGRRILATPNSVPIGLWPLILERAGNDKYHLDENCSDYELSVRKYRTESIYFFLQNSLVPSPICSPSFRKNCPRKRRMMN